MDISAKPETKTSFEQEPKESVLSLKGTSETPEIALDLNKGVLKFSGRSLPEDAKSFYKEILEWIIFYAKNPKKGTRAIFAFDYFNTASSKMILEILDILKVIEAKDDSMKIEWHYLEDDEDMHEAGEDFAEIADLKFEYFSYE